MQKIVSVKFQNGQTGFEFLTDLDLKSGDTIVVDSKNNLQVVTVLEVKDSTNQQVHKWVVDKIDTTAHFDRIGRQKRRDELKKQMETRRKQLEEIQVYQVLAKEDEKMAKLVAEYESL